MQGMAYVLSLRAAKICAFSCRPPPARAFSNGPKRSEEEAFHRQVGTHREAAWLQQSPEGDLAVLYWEGEDPQRYKKGLEQLLRSDDPFGQWVRECFVDIYGFGPEQSLPPMPEQMLDLRIG